MRFILIGIIIVAAAGCSPEVVEEPFEPTDTWERYNEALTQLDIDETLIGSTWREAGLDALRSPTDIEAPFEEIVVLDPHRPQAIAYRFPLRRGRRVTIEIDTETDRYFADIFRLSNDTENANDAADDAVLVASRPDDGNRIELEARRDRYYLLRIQPELLRGGRFRVRIVTTASLAFPVQDAGPDRILSFYGDQRSGGARIHEGVDIFAPRGTPLLATSDAVVYRVGERERGGKIVSLLDETRDLLVYYAHLDEQLVTQGQRVSAGDVIGTVGNTGNAMYTPPHLHIGVYQGGWRNSVDPWEYLVDPPLMVPREIEREDRVGRWYRIAREVTVLRALPAPPLRPRVVNRNPFLFQPGQGVISEHGLREHPAPTTPSTVLPESTAVLVVGASGDRLRVRTVDGSTWLLDADSLRPAGDMHALPVDTPVRDLFSRDVIAVTADSTETAHVQVIGHAGDFLVVALDSGRVAAVNRSVLPQVF